MQSVEVLFPRFGFDKIRSANLRIPQPVAKPYKNYKGNDKVARFKTNVKIIVHPTISAKNTFARSLYHSVKMYTSNVMVFCVDYIQKKGFANLQFHHGEDFTRTMQ